MLFVPALPLLHFPASTLQIRKLVGHTRALAGWAGPETDVAVLLVSAQLHVQLRHLRLLLQRL